MLPIVRGEYREAWALTEPGAGSDLAALAATARSDGNEWVLNGEKWFVTSEGDAGSREWILVERLFIAARCCGAAERLLGEATDWAKEREAFGSPIIGNQGVSFPLADSLTELHAARLMTYHAAHAFDTLADRKIVHGKVAMAKLYASEMAGRVADRAVQIFGGRGYIHDTAAARFYRELRVDRIWEGTSEIQRLIIARGLEKRGPDPYLGWE